MKAYLTSIGFALVLLMSGIHHAYAGSQQHGKPTFTPEAIATFSKDVEKYAASEGARAFIIARRGRPIEDMPKGIRFTHTAIAIYSSIQLSDGNTAKGYAIHNLYQDAEEQGKSHLITDYPVDFFWSAYALEAGIIIPSVEVQQALINLYRYDKAKLLHNSRYSVVANPFNSERQNCTEYTLDVLNAAMYSTTDAAQLKVNAKAYFTPQKVHMSRAKLGLASMFSDGVTLSDHGRKVETTTFGSLARYMQKYDLMNKAVTFTHTGQIKNI
ncbi:DUF2145 domain-containing protein [Alteromonas sp.]|uniref:DUF2145 domain-containing protein n=2 Tax=Alteromonas mediterranea TaxID=314275 RepID=S5AIM2_9ALTE|nr:DUF2145 domain-containing protein [Alteromonas sp.]AGP79194.1 hypothetical protein I633_17700 [Alteromonas mediterranea 615]MEA3380519.1 DUF2145 domain-containing protein [Pseudomonadota bacterium]NQY17588.1 DUF2145 domain-containing protein [Alteromonas sp.]|tara:strand:- start:211 stop:1020 length:810 start_codon:yes stop_codon:yes gene_type:complete